MASLAIILGLVVWNFLEFRQLRAPLKPGVAAGPPRLHTRRGLRLGCGFEEALVPQPIGTRLCPGGVGMITFANAEVMRGRCINVQFSGDASSLQGEIHEHAVLRRADDVVSAMHKEDRRRPGWDTQTRSQFILVL